MAEGDMIWRNTSPQTTGTTAYHVRQVPVLCIKCAEPGEIIHPPGLGVEAVNQDALPPPPSVFTTWHTTTSLLPFSGESLVYLQSRRSSHSQIKDKGFTINPCHRYPSVENRI